jgi:hypothetical protein
VDARAPGRPRRFGVFGRRRDSVPGWWLLALVAAVGVLLRSTGAVEEVDLYWHLRVGEYFLHGKSFPHPDPFAFTLPDVHWHTTQWLSEALLAGTYDAAGFGGIVAVRLVLVVLLLGSLAWLLVRGSAGWSGPTVFAVTAVPLVEFVQDRPQLPSLLLMVWVAWVVREFLQRGVEPRRLVFVAVTYVWANLHGLFILAPAVLLLLAVGELFARSSEGRQSARRLATTALLALVACALTPRGPALLAAPVTFGAAARGFIVEWAPTNLLFSGAYGFGVLLMLAFLAAARGSGRLPAREVFYVLALGFFGMVAIRNIAPASILLSPIVLSWCDAAWRTQSTIRIPARWFSAMASLLLATALLTQVGKPVTPHKPDGIASVLADLPTGTRVLDDYNLSGYLLFRAPHIRVAIDGRADRYGSDFIHHYLTAVSGAPGWKPWVTGLHADYAVLSEHSPLPELMRTQLGWTQVLNDRDFVLLKAP